MINHETVEWPECHKCGEEFNPLRKKLGYLICLSCGDTTAQEEIAHKRKCSAPLFNKGSYQYVSSREDAKWIGR